MNRFNYDRTFSSTLLNHMSMGYLNRNEGYGSVNQEFVDDFPQIAGVAGNNVPPHMTFSDGFTQFGNNAGMQRRQHHHAADVHHQRHGDLDAEARTR